MRETLSRRSRLRESKTVHAQFTGPQFWNSLRSRPRRNSHSIDGGVPPAGEKTGEGGGDLPHVLAQPLVYRLTRELRTGSGRAAQIQHRTWIQVQIFDSLEAFGREPPAGYSLVRALGARLREAPAQKD